MSMAEATLVMARVQPPNGTILARHLWLAKYYMYAVPNSSVLLGRL